MALSISRKEVEDIKPYLEKTVSKFLGFREPSLVTTLMHCLSSGYDKYKTADKLRSSLLDPGKALSLTDKAFDLAKGMTMKVNNVTIANKRPIKTEYDENNIKRKKEDLPIVKEEALSMGQIKDMMLNAQKMIEERKKALSIPSIGVQKNTNGKDKKPQITTDFEKQAKIAQLQAQIQKKLATGIIKTVPSVPKTLNNSSAEKPTPLILDSEGRTIDITGKEVQLTQVIPTLKANIRAKKREEFKQTFSEKSNDDSSEVKFFDSRLTIKSNIRTKRTLKFHEPGKFQQIADRLRMKAQLEKLQNEISQIARKTGISSVTKMALLVPKEEQLTEHCPDVEWWDSVILDGASYLNDTGTVQFKRSNITHLVEHPLQMRPPTDPLKPLFMPVFLTKKERKKLRRQNRRETWKEEQEKIRLGLEPPAEPKLRISNLMRVLGTEAVQDPTKMESHVRAQMAKRQKAHEEANASRRLNPEQRRDKKIRKLQEDTSLGVNVAIYRIKDLSNPSKKFKIETNSKQLFMTGCVIMCKDCNVVIVEGGPKQQKKYKRLMLHRMKWEDDVIKNKDESEPKSNNKCSLVWEGMSKQRNFGEIKFKVCASEKLAREQLKKHGVEHYWDLAYSDLIMD
ncbi:U4/U6 small nuclear ribonucleoprotein Prp3 [Sipha flava]|uniref:U4/U6 small nuclear ribonucleoprotein Prp3 n=1 Tax=Sipha flava TaxID=143950 RepID=A0A2S2QBA2_9HEMI|nr:U4/U6 small nuclear ribonucleoprotein Prp3 [Sipha flava]XP_025416654.1 U4/U6 small nuclear ribonucleoprotein Prp3 [Sipha flava]